MKIIQKINFKFRKQIPSYTLLFAFIDMRMRQTLFFSGNKKRKEKKNKNKSFPLKSLEVNN